MCITSSDVFVEQAASVRFLFHLLKLFYHSGVEFFCNCRDELPGDMFLTREQPLTPCEKHSRKQGQVYSAAVS